MKLLLLLSTLLLTATSWGAETAAPPTTNAPAASNPTATNAVAESKAPAEVKIQFLEEPAEYDPDEMYARINVLLRGGRNFEVGQKLFEMASCVICHRFGEGAGGIGPDITGAGSRFDTRELLESIIMPSKVISDLYGAKFYKLVDGKVYRGRAVAEGGDEIVVSQGWTKDPKSGTTFWGAEDSLVRLKRYQLDSVEEDTENSPMPTGLVSMFNEATIADLAGYLISGGDPSNRIFRPLAARPATNAPPAANPPRP